MKYYLISDTHLGHTKLIEWGRDAMFETKIKTGLNVISPEDVLIHMGDVCIGNDEVNNKIFTNLPCKKVLVKGNHDNKSNAWYQKVGWDFVCERFDLKLFGKNIVFTHIPTLIMEDEINIHGHTHGNDHREAEYKQYYTERHIDISPELVGFVPLSLEKLIL